MSAIVWYLYICSGILRYLLVCSGICRHLISAGIFRYIPVSSYICNHLQISAGIFRYLRASSDICRCGPPLNKIMTNHMEYTESLQAPPGPDEAGRLLQSLAWPLANAALDSHPPVSGCCRILLLISTTSFPCPTN